MQVIPLAAVPSQLVQATLDGQSVSLSIYQLGFPPNADLYCDLSSDGAAIVTGRKCRAYGGAPHEAPPALLLDSRYWGFQGDFLFVDTQGDEDPQYSGLGTRWQLVYYAAADLSAAGDATA